MDEEIKSDSTQEQVSEGQSTQNVTELEAKVADLETKLAEANDKYVRAHADLENTKRRLEKEKYMAIDYANEKFAKDLLGIIDTLELALTHADADSEKFKEGIQLTLDNMSKVFERNGISAVGIENGFDPNFHEAVMQTPSSEHDDNAVIAVLQKGYVLRERVLRPALVNVCKN